MKFSDRIGVTKPKTFVQLNGMDESLKNCLWNVFLKHISYSIEELYEEIIGDFFKRPVKNSEWDDFALFNRNKYCLEEIERLYFALEWFDIYNFIEFIPNTDYFRNATSYKKNHKKNFIADCNKYLARELSGYRFINTYLVPITNDAEIKSVEDTFVLSETHKNLKGIKIHLETALATLANKKSPNYRNSIKESISAVETACRILTGESTLGDALKKLTYKNIYINNEIKSGFVKLYAYTNSKENGIRHAIVDEVKEPDLEDAKYMLVSCSAFINYVIGKSALGNQI
ncbi:hypothetical protein H9Q13_09825 [Pontibacter sp. JH31]|uniref:HEPN AbiJ-N-terminal domain-containing protein n=1 Tax=Pontibacter aquaedesilientis TaxID=2766980 RepID=A0ABR7XGS2_9BACT|nr:hypothetical protein [Pontibacter aquaedesilientis]MBD1397464.1 hypothetical protein [Pontibacter aquaedesilientis]